MVPYLVKVLVGNGPKIGVALVPQNFAEIAMRDVVEDGAPILVNLLALKLQDLKKKSLLLPHLPHLLRPQGPLSGQVTSSHKKLTLKVKSVYFCNSVRPL